MKIFVAANNKGGVGKSELTRRLLIAWARMGARVVGIDLDGQANLSDDLTSVNAMANGGWYAKCAEHSITDVLEMRCDLAAALTTVYLSNNHSFRIALADGELDNTADDMTTRPLAIMVLKNAIEQTGDLADILIIDCPPNLGPLTYSAFIAAGRDGQVIVPARPDEKSYKGVLRVGAKLREIRQLLGAAPSIRGIVAGQVRDTTSHRNGLLLLSQTGLPLLASIPLRDGVKADAELDAAYTALAIDLLVEAA